MKHIQTFESFLNEAAGISPKDWDRMVNLALKADSGETVAKLIKDKNKAVARFITGLKLSNSPLRYNDSWKEYSGNFSALGNLAIKLGATTDEITDLYNKTEVPISYSDKMNKLSGKKLDNRFVGSISKTVLDAGYDINYTSNGGNAITGQGKDAMSRNGRKWTIGYRAEIIKGSAKFPFAFDAITDEGDGPTLFIASENESDRLFSSLSYKVVGKNDFVANLKKILQEIQ